MKKTYVVLALILNEQNKILVEQRLDEGEFVDDFFFPGGEAKEHELNNLDQALIREMQEELSITITDFTPLPHQEDIVGIKDHIILKPFFIKSWKGKMSSTIFDNNNPLFWVELKTQLNSSVEPVRKVTKLLVNYLNQKPLIRNQERQR